MTADQLEELDKLINELPPRPRKILKRRFCLDGEKFWTLKALGEDFGVGKERIRQIEAHALRKIRQRIGWRGLKKILLSY